MNQQTEVKDAENKDGKSAVGLAALIGRSGEVVSSATSFGATIGLAPLGGSYFGGVVLSKAGVLGLVLTVATVAGSVGLMSNPPAQKVLVRDPEGGLFLARSRPSVEPVPAEKSPRAADAGAGSGLDYFLKVEEKGGGAVESPAAKPEAVPDVKEGTFFEPAQGGKLAPLKAGLKGGNLGTLSKSLSGSAGGSSARVSATPVLGLSRQGESAGAIVKARSGPRGRVGGEGVRRVARVRKGSAMRQLGSVRRDHLDARSSRQAGLTYDGGMRGAGSSIAGAGFPKGWPEATGRAESGPPPNQPGTSKGWAEKAEKAEEKELPFPVEGKNATPYQKVLDQAQNLLMYASLMLLAAVLLAKYAKDAPSYLQWIMIWTARVLSYAAIGISLTAVALGGMIAFGKHGQPLQGGMIMLAGLFLTGVGLMVLQSIGFEVNRGAGSGTDYGGIEKELSGWENWIKLAGLGVMAALAVGKMGGSKEMKASRAPDCNYFDCHSSHQMPAQRALERFLA